MTDRSIARKGKSLSTRCKGSRPTRALTLNSKFVAEGVMIVISWAVEALCMAFGPMAAKDTLPTRTLCATVRDLTFGVRKEHLEAIIKEPTIAQSM